ncbi:MAG: FAD-binding oxidoreductase [Undibacterium sp.]|nr:FAD-binding oxidoreductase [Undibacterium sp.]
MNEFINACQTIVGAPHVLTKIEDQASYLQDWRQRAVGKALAVILPASTSEVAQIVKLCAHHAVSIVPQGGNTGLVLGSIPDTSGDSIVLSLRRLNQIRQIDPSNNTMTVDAGCILAQVQNMANQADRLFPLSLASEGSCTVGGNLASNAGGTAVLRYGNMRELCLGLEVVDADGEIWDGLRGLRKDNTGYHLRELFIGSEGTLGIITGAVLKLFPKPRSQTCCFAALSTVENAISLLNLLQARFASQLTGFELINQFSLELVHTHFPQFHRVFSQSSPYYLLLEISSHDTEETSRQRIEEAMTQALEQALVLDVAIAQSLAQAQHFWILRESISEAQAKQGKNIKHDISLPISSIGNFISETALALQANFIGSQIVCFGHLGDGNLHYNISPALDQDVLLFLEKQEAINRLVHDQVARFNGSISAEHGIGTLKKHELPRYKSALELAMMLKIKKALDPHNRMNPGKIFEDF